MIKAVFVNFLGSICCKFIFFYLLFFLHGHFSYEKDSLLFTDNNNIKCIAINSKIK